MLAAFKFLALPHRLENKLAYALHSWQKTVDRYFGGTGNNIIKLLYVVLFIIVLIQIECEKKQ